MTFFCFLKIVVLVYTISHFAISSNDDVEGYYWRDYEEYIPKDAFEAAHTNDNKTLYVGQVLHENLLIPAIIDPILQQISYEWGRAELFASDIHSVKILCTRHPEQMQWIQTKYEFAQNVYGKIVGGNEQPIYLIYIGRKLLDGDYTLGKVTLYKQSMPTTGWYSYLHTTKNGVYERHEEFDVLTFNPNIIKVK